MTDISEPSPADVAEPPTEPAATATAATATATAPVATAAPAPRAAAR